VVSRAVRGVGHRCHLSLTWPLAYIAWTLAHGAAAHWYPYPFTNVDRFGYITVIRNGVMLNLVLVGVGALYMWLDHRLPTAPGHPSDETGPEAGGR
jgi:hypothetical protein